MGPSPAPGGRAIILIALLTAEILLLPWAAGVPEVAVYLRVLPANRRELLISRVRPAVGRQGLSSQAGSSSSSGLASRWPEHPCPGSAPASGRGWTLPLPLAVVGCVCVCVWLGVRTPVWRGVCVCAVGGGVGGVCVECVCLGCGGCVCGGNCVGVCGECMCIHIYTRNGFLSRCLADASTKPLPSEACLGTNRIDVVWERNKRTGLETWSDGLPGRLLGSLGDRGTGPRVMSEPGAPDPGRLAGALCPVSRGERLSWTTLVAFSKDSPAPGLSCGDTLKPRGPGLGPQHSRPGAELSPLSKQTTGPPGSSLSPTLRQPQ